MSIRGTPAQQGDAALLSSMPIPGSAWSFLQRRRILVCAFVISLALHLFAYLATPFFIQGWREQEAARFDAVLITSAVPQLAKAPAVRELLSNRRPAAKSVRPKRVPVPDRDAKIVTAENLTDASPPQVAATELENIAPATEVGLPLGPESRPAAADLPVPETAAKTAVTATEKSYPPPAELPSRIVIAYKMSSSISDGVAEYTWSRNGQQFEIDSTMQATGFIVGNFVGVLHQVSRGEIISSGLRPSSFKIRRGDGAPDTAEFLHASSELKLSRGGGQVRTVPLAPQLQDMQSFLFQLAYDAPRLQAAEDRLDIMVTNARKVYRHRFRQVGIETLQTRAGPVQTVHLRSEATDPEDIYEVWLTPAEHYIPVKLKFYAGRFPVELIATSIRTTP